MSAPPVTAPDFVRDLSRLRQQLSDAPRPIGLGGVLLGSGVIEQLPDVIRDLRVDGKAVALLADCRPMAGVTIDVKAEIEDRLRLAGISVRRVTVGDSDARVHVDAPTLDDVTRECIGAGALISVGSGSVADLGKAVSAQLALLPHVVVQTAASVNGFADDMSVLLVDGVKRTTITRWPERLLIDTDVLALAPIHLNRAGLGDLLAGYTAPADWRLASFVGQDDTFASPVVALVRAYTNSVLEKAKEIGVGDHDAVEVLAAALALSGISMGVVGRTSVASGMEHTVSHLLEMTQGVGDAAPLHGAKVGVLSVLAALLWVRIRAAARRGDLREIRFPSREEMCSRVYAAFEAFDPSLRMAAECWRDYSRKLERWHQAQEVLLALPERWSSFDSELDELLASPELLVGALRDAGAPTRLSELGIDADTARWALANCHLMRDRFTIADLAFFSGHWEAEDIDLLLHDAALLGAGL